MSHSVLVTKNSALYDNSHYVNHLKSPSCGKNGYLCCISRTPKDVVGPKLYIQLCNYSFGVQNAFRSSERGTAVDDELSLYLDFQMNIIYDPFVSKSESELFFARQ